jgi:hypothetical protein
MVRTWVFDTQNLGSIPSSTISRILPANKNKQNIRVFNESCTLSEDGRVVKAKVLRSFGAIRVGSNPTPRISIQTQKQTKKQTKKLFSIGMV